MVTKEHQKAQFVYNNVTDIMAILTECLEKTNDKNAKLSVGAALYSLTKVKNKFKYASGGYNGN